MFVDIKTFECVPIKVNKYGVHKMEKMIQTLLRTSMLGCKMTATVGYELYEDFEANMSLKLMSQTS